MFNGDSFANLDLSIFRKFRITEDQIIELRVEMFNATNHPTWNRPTAQLDNPNFGKIFSMRSTQCPIRLGLKIHFWRPGRRPAGALFGPVRSRTLVR